jgi:D-sedoheptulose 7-phosphate isomerase
MMGTATVGRTAQAHIAELHAALDGIESQTDLLESWGVRMATVLYGGGRLLAAGNGGNAAQAHHLVADLVGRLDDRPPLSALALTAESSGLTSIGNDYGFDKVFARQVTAHARTGDIVMLMSTSGASPNILAAAEAAHDRGAHVWAMSGPTPHPLMDVADEVFCVPAANADVVQEIHLVAVHMLCAHLNRTMAAFPAPDGRPLNVDAAPP